jgi:hypothetical protein
MTIEEIIKSHVLKTLSESRSKLSAAKKLGICIKTLRNYLHKWGRSDLVNPDFKTLNSKKQFSVNAKQRDDYYNWEPK